MLIITEEILLKGYQDWQQSSKALTVNQSLWVSLSYYKDNYPYSKFK